MDEIYIPISEFIQSLEELPYAQELSALGVFLTFLILRSLFARIIISFAKKLTLRTKNTIDYDLVCALENPVKFLFVIIGASLALQILSLPESWLDITAPTISALYTYCLFWALFCTIPPITKAVFSLGQRMGKAVNEDLQQFFIRSVEVIVLVIGGVAILEQWNINVSAFLGGLGLAGMAVALAAKDTVANLFGTLTIFTDKTFQKGDWIETPHVEGTVEVIGLRASKVRTFAKALVNVPNAKLANSPITNWSRMTNRRIKMTLGLEYRTTAQQLETIVDALRDYIANDAKVEAKGPVAQMVHLTHFGASSIDINLYYFTKTTNWEEWRQIRSDHIIAFKRIVEEAEAGFAFPSQSLYLEQMPEETA
ncbi:Mechanosensitive ion channel MscS [Candidatus Terasakiella magnetica]|uniref:Mechanosensitive ion channel MscS n=1 Tax=Candidatus Terasakiella magnetica TaxID=1867952 RepID=A0A1C3RLA2_9PROT|nr:mechanosensitive ion channel family protein [Candidatus Terasakiella magnetica]SCA58037.1 Mechanosensitive ion channel MscS [Candidatus Terasakiella magnetica]